jgi:hypothetical protein
MVTGGISEIRIGFGIVTSTHNIAKNLPEMISTGCDYTNNFTS